ncbi:hypothetical protein TetV_200 [Tetraselmis virus 1]|uniref:Uncharacterized protein n=1 Tax=Tetraselmis virus 1 TaxID=2060617 RepID=A0A2P0VN10_9VIRU|nr:hypothetical protein QJ968_gp200 [Tetraselmis virus 1]AUF82292.1 hypothetical protein TetV_200 [Tetraselmis virus 1]
MEKAGIAVALFTALAAGRKMLPPHQVRDKLTSFMYHTGVVLTLGMSKSTRMGPIWNSTVEPVVVDLLDDVSYSVRYGLIKGLRSDNKKDESVVIPNEKNDSSLQMAVCDMKSELTEIKEELKKEIEVEKDILEESKDKKE